MKESFVRPMAFHKPYCIYAYILLKQRLSENFYISRKLFESVNHADHKIVDHKIVDHKIVDHEIVDHKIVDHEKKIMVIINMLN